MMTQFKPSYGTRRGLSPQGSTSVTMRKVKRHALRLFALVLAGAAVWSLTASAGIPQPGLVLYGKVFNEDGALVTEGSVVWTYTPGSGGPAIAVSASLREIKGLGGPFSYRVLLPFEAAVTGHPVSGGLPVTVESVSYTRQGRLVNSNVVMTHVVELSGADLGGVQRVDLCVGCSAEAETFHSADVNQDLMFSLDEVLRVVELHTGSIAHEYHCNPGLPDGFGTGAGARSATPHTADYYGGPDWRISAHELVRIFDLFSSTPEHSYLAELASEDGFRKNDGQPYWQKSAGPGLYMQRTIQGGQPGAGRTLQFTVSMDFMGGDPVSAVGLFEPLPAGWTFAGASGEAMPLVLPALGAANEMHFAWLSVPAFPCTFTYEVTVPENASVLDGYCELLGEGIYRTVTGDDAQKTVYFWDDSPTADTDGDGVPDVVESGEDADADGIPNFIDVDSDNDGLSDIEEVGFDGNADYNPYHPITNPTGTDSNIYNPDTDGDGISDGEETANHRDPLFAEPEVPVPAASAYGLAVMVLLLAIAAAKRVGRAL